MVLAMASDCILPNSALPDILLPEIIIAMIKTMDSRTLCSLAITCHKMYGIIGAHTKNIVYYEMLQSVHYITAYNYYITVSDVKHSIHLPQSDYPTLNIYFTNRKLILI